MPTFFAAGHCGAADAFWRDHADGLDECSAYDTHPLLHVSPARARIFYKMRWNLREKSFSIWTDSR